ncbi:MAG: hypothetical protein EXX96DRAFT_605175 [Benjaminiella poitrasii]|nr:MAG: hypothetical protein EXX96DRAFT_605175 [Benjaminiella poitrasii]
MSSFETTANNLLTLNNEPFPNQQPSTNVLSDSKHISKLILRSALQKAKVAVRCDSTNDITGAIHAYKEAISLLERVLSNVEKENERQRLQSIHDSYSERIKVLSVAVSSRSNDNNNIQEQHSKLSPISNTQIIRKMASLASIKNQCEPLTSSYDHEIAKVPAVFHLQSSKSTPTRQLVKKQLNDTRDEEDDDEEEGSSKLNEPLMINEQPNLTLARQNSSNEVNKRLSVSSSDSSDAISIAEQPIMTLPSLMKRKEETSHHKAILHTRTSSLPKVPPLLMQRSSSMITTSESISSPEDTELSATARIVSMSRPIINRPSVGGLGSMRRKAINRLSIEGFSVNRNRDKLSQSPGNYGHFIRDQIKPATAGDVDYMEVTKKNNNQHELQEDALTENESTENGHSQLRLLLALEKSMLEGAYITQKLYIPKALWQQTNIRFSSMDIKVSACETLMNDITRLENWNYLDDLISSTRLLEQFENSVEQLQITLSKKLKRISMSENGSTTTNHQHTNNSSRDSISAINRIETGKKAQSFMSWGTKLTKSVERMNAFSLTKTEDQYKNYIEVLQKLFTKVHVLEHWLNYYYAEKKKNKNPQYDVLILKLSKIYNTVNQVVGGFIIKDITVLLAKWLKRGSSWVNE